MNSFKHEQDGPSLVLRQTELGPQGEGMQGSLILIASS